VRGALADTHALLWWLLDDRRLSVVARDVLAAGEPPVHFSAASIWEIAIKTAAGKLVVPDSYLEAIELDGFLELPMSARHTMRAGELPVLHRDPFDRMIVAQAQIEDLTVITHDRSIAEYDVNVMW